MKRYLPAVILITAAVLLIVIGILLQHESVLNKAVRICMECVGLG